ncbi:MAG: flagellar hook-associated protein FlgK [Robiginitomaculum sp.]|nr:MAG: flagellar hook-associated protein FlgK [Robiginitomaculum sp.]
MSLSSALNAANSGLAVTSRRADITAGNIANATTPGYVRRTAIIGENVLNGQGEGARFIGVGRTQDLALSRERRDAGGSAARADVLSRAYNDLNRELGAPDDTYGLFYAYQNVESAIRDLAVTPESSAYQNAAYNSLNALTTQFSELQTIGNNQRINADNAIARSVRDVNDSLHKIQELNLRISGLSGSGEGSASLEDERQLLLDKISQIIPIKDYPRDNGTVEIITKEGIFLLAGSVHELEFTPAGVIPPDASYSPTGGLLSGITVDGENLTPGTGSFAISAGSLAGYFEVRDNVAPDFLAKLDSLAANLVTRLSGSTIDPTNGASSPGILTDAGNAVDPLNIVGISGRLRLNAAIDPNQGGTPTRLRDGIGATTTGPAGNADILNNILDALTSSETAPTGSGLLGNQTSTELAAGFSSFIGEARVYADALAASTNSRAVTLSDLELSKSAVDTDTELQSLMLIEQAYAANARVIQTVGEMLDILMQL